MMNTSTIEKFSGVDLRPFLSGMIDDLDEADPPRGDMLPIALIANTKAPIGEVRRIGWEALGAMLGTANTGTKDGQAWMPVDTEPGPRTGERVRSISALVLDIEADAESIKGDNGQPVRDEHGDIVKRVIGREPPDVGNMLAELGLWGWRGVIHTSYSHTGEHPRYRLVFAISRPLAAAEVKPLGLHVAGLLGLSDCIDAACLEPARLFYLPRSPAERIKLFRHAVIEGLPLPVDTLLSDAAMIEEARKSATATRRTGQSVSVIQAFNDGHDVGAILEQHGYIQKDRNRWLWPDSTTGLAGVRLLPDRSGKEVIYSSHGGDPLNDGRAHDAFDCWRILNHGGDMITAVREAARLLGMDRQQPTQVDLSGILKGVGVNAVAACASSENKSVCAAAPVASLDDYLVDLGETVSPESEHPHVVAKHVPKGEVTLFAGHGSAGKSYIVLLILIHVALGMPFGALATTRTKVLFYSAEDDKHEMLRRVAKICRALSINQSALNGWLFLMDVSELDPTLYRVSARGDTTFMPMLDSLTTFVQEHDIGLTVIDNASDTFDGNEIARSQVRAFIRSLRVRLARPDRAVILLAHVSKAAAHNKKTALATDEDYSGSTAWHNSVRSRLSLDTDDNGISTLKHLKANKGPKADPISLEWHEGTPMLAGTYHNPGADIAAAFVKTAEKEKDKADKDVLVAIIWDFDRRSERVPVATTGPYSAYRTLKTVSEFPHGLTSERTVRLLRDLERDGRIFRVTRCTARRKHVDCFTCSPVIVESAPMPTTDKPVSAGRVSGCVS